MAIKKEDVVNGPILSDLPTADELEVAIDHFLSQPKSGRGDRNLEKFYFIRLPDATIVSTEVEQELHRRYTEAGWGGVYVVYDQIHEYSTQLKLLSE